ncbi:hypothetical protein BD626DRAFT_490131 [Schizophyllum amplum]|uniref:Uncharacterized protein n=1 Tax=Schizophyllum amplum TaxID=97359 RepID=A0A550CJC1_9AGAR|nr:hypothetical protein BD626DRAFT_490131 [Auriculariopsis ampla]
MQARLILSWRPARTAFSLHLVALPSVARILLCPRSRATFRRIRRRRVCTNHVRHSARPHLAQSCLRPSAPHPRHWFRKQAQACPATANRRCRCRRRRPCRYGYLSLCKRRAVEVPMPGRARARIKARRAAMYTADIGCCTLVYIHVRGECAGPRELLAANRAYVLAAVRRCRSGNWHRRGGYRRCRSGGVHCRWYKCPDWTKLNGLCMGRSACTINLKALCISVWTLLE